MVQTPHSLPVWVLSVMMYPVLTRYAPITLPFSGRKHMALALTTSGKRSMDNKLKALLTLLSLQVAVKFCIL